MAVQRRGTEQSRASTDEPPHVPNLFPGAAEVGETSQPRIVVADVRIHSENTDV